MIVLFKGYNNHSNRLFQAIHLEAFCMEHALNFYNPSFWKMKDLYGIRGKRYDKLVWAVCCSLNKVRLLPKLKLRSTDFQETYERKLMEQPLTLVHGWAFRRYDLTDKYRSELVRKYSLKKSLYEQDELYREVSALDRTTCNLVGVHVRKGDYKTWRNGIYYFEDEVYQRCMDELETALSKATGKKTRYIVFSNEALRIQAAENVMLSSSPWYVDQQVMSLCDYLIGPPSTFTKWASYLGDAKLFQITDASIEINLDEFVACRG